MTRPKVSIVIPTHNRAHLFKRSLECYAMQDFKDFEILLLDDDSTDDMEYLCRAIAPSLGLDLKHLWFKKAAGVGYRDGACQINYGIRAAAGDIICTTSPEVMPGKNTIDQMVKSFAVEGPNSTAWISAKVYMLGPQQQMMLDTVDWRHLGAAAAARLLPDFYTMPSAEYQGTRDFLPSEIDKTPMFGASLFCGMTRAGWRTMGGFPESEVWGTPDVSFLAERWRRGTKVGSMQHPDATCVHQFHDLPGDISSPRDMAKCLANNLTGPWDFIRW